MPCGGCAKPIAFCSVCGQPIMAMSKKYPETEPDGVWVDDKPVCNPCLQKTGGEKSKNE